jgi:uncharacterized protein YndB with AHSA1/START domain
MAWGERDLVITRLLDAPRDLVFQAWTRPDHLVRWWGPAGFTLTACEVDFRVGGAWRTCLRSPDGRDFWLRGIYRRIVAPERLDFSCEVGDENGNLRAEELISVLLGEQGGKTKLTLHIRFGWLAADVETLAPMEASWSQSLDRLAAHAVRGRGTAK